MSAALLPFQAAPGTENAANIPVVSTGELLPTSGNKNKDAPLLFTPYKLRDVSFKNRIVVSPMCQYSAHDGFPNAWHLAHYGQYAVRGAGLIIVEATGVLPNGRISPNDLGIWKDEHTAHYRTIAQLAHAHGARIGIQLAHAGRKASSYSPHVTGGEHTKVAPENEGGWPENVVGPSAKQDWPLGAKVKEATKEQIQEIVKAFVEAARRAEEAGYDVVEIHGAHGYLVHQFLSPLTNQRTDEYGGSFENRARLVLDIVKSVRTVWPTQKPLFVRLSASEFVPSGWDIEESIKLSALLQSAGADLIDVSSGGNLPGGQTPYHVPGWNVPFAERIRKEAGIATGPVGGITSGKQAEEILQGGKGDLVLIARAFLADPTFVDEAAHQLKVDVSYPVQYGRAKPRPAED
ncbi:hypothetical protein HK097_002654 [Rhizophlyctis rosea]|uniref:NADH:flavin oxidoreductase/NADH oxidase N-terminal domain-containing protein n=1 Tax=Rhizophlyctis rosea TaxID=64517 RepID=A0AAD5SAR2_9FUNG|nr:hypothetical protein HK097_002654 [Rhizophlyctis rosea]